MKFLAVLVGVFLGLSVFSLETGDCTIHDFRIRSGRAGGELRSWELSGKKAVLKTGGADLWEAIMDMTLTDGSTLRVTAATCTFEQRGAKLYGKTVRVESPQYIIEAPEFAIYGDLEYAVMNGGVQMTFKNQTLRPLGGVLRILED